MTRTIFIGDVHGCYEEFCELLDRLAFVQGTDDLVLLGDLMDRGPDPVGVVRLARDLGVRCVLGNHDEKHLRWARHEDRRLADSSYKNPMRPLPDKAREESAALREDGLLDWLRSLPTTIALGDWRAVHAGFEPLYPMSEQRADKLLRVRYVDATGKMVPISTDIDQPEGSVRWATVWKEPFHVVYGHHARNKEPMVDVHTDAAGARWLRYGIDTACCFGGRLTALVVPDLAHAEEIKFVSVPARGTYAELWRGDAP